MTYREKLKMEHPEKVNEMFIGGCKGCPSGVGYGPENVLNDGCIVNEAKCTACWNKVIPGTEEREYENLSRDELITIVKLLEGRIETKDKVIANYTAACTDKNTRIIDLSAIGKSKDTIIEKQEKEIKRLKEEHERMLQSKDAIIEKQEHEIECRGKLLDYRDQKIQKLEAACRNYNDEVNRLNKLLNGRDDELRARIIENNQLKDKIDSLNVYPSQAMQTYGTCCCKPDVIAEKDKEIERLKKDLEFEISHKNYWYNECHRLVKKINELENSNQELKDALEEEKKEHAKHHSLFGKYFTD